MELETFRPKTPPTGTKSQHAEDADETQRACDSSQKPTTGEAESGSGDIQANKKLEIKGVRFAFLFMCILLASFFIGYVCINSIQQTRTC